MWRPAASAIAFAVRQLARVLVVAAIVIVLLAPEPARTDATAKVVATTYFPQLEHNVADIAGTLEGGVSFAATFLQYFEQTGGVERWGYPTSAIFEETPGTLTQYYQRGVIDWRPPPGGGDHTFVRRFAWDDLGGGRGESEDQRIEPGLTNPNPGDELGPWGHKVSNMSVEGVAIGFADFFDRLGGVAAFGFPMTDARPDDHPQAVVRDPGRPVDGRIRQYFQAAVLEHHPESSNAPVRLRLLGDALRDSRYPGRAWQRHVAFGPEAPFAVGHRIAMKRSKLPGPRGSTVDEVAAFLEPSLLRVDTDLGCGSGFLVTTSGYVVTSWHLVANAQTIDVSGPTGLDERAQLVTGDAELNVALLRVPGDDHVPVIWDDSSTLDPAADLVSLGYDAAGIGDSGATGCQSEPTPTTTSLSDVSSGRWPDIRPWINAGHSGGPVVSRTGRVVGIATVKSRQRERIGDLIPAAEALPLVTAWIDALSRGVTPALPYRPRFDRVVLAENDRMACPGAPGPDGDVIVQGSKIEFTATVELSSGPHPVGLFQFRDAYDSEWKRRDLVYYGPLGTSSGESVLEWLRDSFGSYTVLREGDHSDIVTGESFHIKFSYDSGSVALHINGKEAYLEDGLPYGDNIWLKVECLASTRARDMFYHDLRITGIALPEN